MENSVRGLLRRGSGRLGHRVQPTLEHDYNAQHSQHDTKAEIDNGERPGALLARRLREATTFSADAVRAARHLSADQRRARGLGRPQQQGGRRTGKIPGGRKPIQELHPLSLKPK